MYAHLYKKSLIILNQHAALIF